VETEQSNRRWQILPSVRNTRPIYLVFVVEQMLCVIDTLGSTVTKPAFHDTDILARIFARKFRVSDVRM